MLTLYLYPKCSTCQKAKKWLEHHNIPFETVDMITHVPEASKILSWIENGSLPIRRYFNTSGMKYRELGLKDQVDDFSPADAAAVLATDGMLLKRPILEKEGRFLINGFKENEYEGVLKES